MVKRKKSYADYKICWQTADRNFLVQNHFFIDQKFKFVQNFNKKFWFFRARNQYFHYIVNRKYKLTHFATKSGEILISSRRAGSTLQKRSLIYKTQKKLKANEKKTFFYVFLISLMMLDFVIRYTNKKTNKFI
jgi:hypothetical protein